MQCRYHPGIIKPYKTHVCQGGMPSYRWLLKYDPPNYTPWRFSNLELAIHLQCEREKRVTMTTKAEVSTVTKHSCP